MTGVSSKHRSSFTLVSSARDGEKYWSFALTKSAAAGLEVSVEEVPVGAIIQVKPGEKIPLDGIVVAGSSRVDQSMLTGESVPVKPEVGSEVGRKHTCDYCFCSSVLLSSGGVLGGKACSCL
jgi:magnesium-transporting ATPase (P-type)